MEFKVGDKVKVVRNIYVGPPPVDRTGWVGYICEIRDGEEYPYQLGKTPSGGRLKNVWFKDGELKLLNRGSKAREFKFIAVYEENNVDPIKEFFTKKEAQAWVEEAKEDVSIDFESIIIYPVGTPLFPVVKTKVSLKEA